MSWFKREKKSGLEMSLEYFEGVTYKQLKSLLGQPDKVESFSNGRPFNAFWRISVFNIPIEVRIDSGDWAFRNWPNKKNYTVPSIIDEKVDLVQIVGKREFVKNIVIPLFEFSFGLTYEGRSAIKFIFKGYIS